jgi:hypothetical protein
MRTPRFPLFLAMALAVMFPLLVGGPADAHHDSIEGSDARGRDSLSHRVLSERSSIEDVPSRRCMTRPSPPPGAALSTGTPGSGMATRRGRHYTASFRFFGTTAATIPRRTRRPS